MSRPELLPPRREVTRPPTAVLSERLGLVDAVDTLLNRGVVLSGEAMISLAGVDLVYLGLNLLVSSVETLQQPRGGVPGDDAGGPPAPLRPPGPAPTLGEPAAATPGSILAPGSAPRPDAMGHEPPGPALAGLVGLPERVEADPGSRPERGLAQLVLTLVELLRQVLERQAVRRMAGDRLSETQVEQMGRALLELETRLAELRELFELSEDDLNLDLGPLGKLL